jgi:heme oxygenase
VTDDVLATLRHATAKRHALLDDGLAIGRAGATLADYQQHLRLLHAWLAPLEAWLAGFDDGPQAEPTLPPLARAALIASDLAHPSMPTAAGLRDRPWPAHASAAYRWGVCYVAEGSQLGGALLYQRLHRQLAPHPLAYLKGQAEGPGPRWRAFMLALRAQVRGADAIDDACRGACDAFDRILALRS